MSHLSHVITRSGLKDVFKLYKIFERLDATRIHLSLDEKQSIADSVVAEISDGVETQVIDNLIAQKCHALAVQDIKFDDIAVKIISENIDRTLVHSITNKFGISPLDPLNTYSYCLGWMLCDGLISQDYYQLAADNAKDLTDWMQTQGRRLLTWPAYEVLKKYARTSHCGVMVEIPEFVYMRVALTVSNGDISMAKRLYVRLNNKQISFGTPIFSSAGTRNPQLASCFVMNTSDNRESISYLLHEMLITGSSNGGTAASYSSIRSAGSKITSTGFETPGIKGIYSGLKGLTNVFNQGPRPATHAAYLEMWHTDLFFHLEECINVGRKFLFPALWIPDEFFRRVYADEDWYFINPQDVPGLELLYDNKLARECLDANETDFAFTFNYRKAISDGKYVSKIKATTLWQTILTSCEQNGLPYLCSKDNANRLSNHKHLGTIKASNLCTEIYEYHDDNMTAVCNIGSVILSNIDDYIEFDDVVDLLITALTNMIFNNAYPCERSKVSNHKLRPVGAGIQGFADYLIKRNIPYESKQAGEIASELSERLYYKAVETSCRLATIYGAYDGFELSNLGMYEFHWEMYQKMTGKQVTTRLDWEALRSKVKVSGCANSLLIALAPTATSSTFAGSSASFEPLVPIYIRDTNRKQDEVVINRVFIDTLMDAGLWNRSVANEIISSVSGRLPDVIPKRIRKLFKGVYEMKPTTITRIASKMTPFVDQGISKNLFLSTRDIKALSDVIFMSWLDGQKTLVYYTRAVVEKATQGIYLSKSSTTSGCDSCSA